jgi:uncharacterized protein (UPF0147 family)
MDLTNTDRHYKNIFRCIDNKQKIVTDYLYEVINNEIIIKNVRVFAADKNDKLENYKLSREIKEDMALSALYIMKKSIF